MSGIEEELRIVLPLSRPVPARDYKAAWAWVRNFLQPFILDKVATAVSTAFFLPSCPPGYDQYARSFIGEGAPLVLPTLGAPKSSALAVVPSEQLIGDKIDWVWLKQRLRAYDRDTEVRKAFAAVLKGLPFARPPEQGRPGNRDAMLTRMAGVLGGMALQCDPAQLAELFAPSLAVMAEESPDDPPPDLENAGDKIARAQSSMLAKSELAAQASPSEWPEPAVLEESRAAPCTSIRSRSFAGRLSSVG